MLGKLHSNIFGSTNTKNIARSLFGVVSAVFIAMIWGIAMPQVAAIFAIMLLTKGSKALGLKNSLAAIVSIVIFGGIGLFFANIVRDHPLETILILCLIVFWSFRLVSIPEPIRMMALTFALMFPFLSLTAEVAAYFVFVDTLINLAIALTTTQLAFLFFTDTTAKEAQPKEKKQEQLKYNMNKVAVNGMLMLMPITLYFFYFTVNTFLVTFIYVIIIGLDPLMYKSKYPYYVIVANLIGGTFAITAYNLLTISPNFFFYIIIITAVGLFFSYHVFSKKETSTLIYPMAYRSFYLVSSIIFISKDTAGDSLSIRLLGLVFAIVYVVVAYQFLNTINNPVLNEEEAPMPEKALKTKEV